MKRWIADMNLRKKLYTLICILIIIPVMTASIVTDAIFISRYKAQGREVMLNTLMQAKNNIRYVLDEVENISLMMLYDESIQSLYRALVLKKGNAGNANVAVLRRNVLKSLSTLVFNRSYVDAVLVTSGHEKLFESGEAVTREDPALYARAVEAMGRPVWTEARQLNHTVRVNPQYYVSMLRAISDLNAYGQIIGVCRISFEESVLSETLHKISVGDDCRAIIYDRDGNVVSSTDRALYGTCIADSEYFRLIGQSAGDSGYVETRERGERYTHLYFRLRDPDWIVVQTVDDRYYQVQFIPLIGMMAAALVFCMLFAVVYSLLISKTVLRPIKQMYQEMDKVRKGNLDISIPYQSSDEIGQLGQQFVRMTQELRQLIRTKYEQQILLKESELKYLESQINPHFLYNTLDTIHWTAVRNGDKAVCEQIEALSDLFRHVLNKGEEITTLGEELLHLQNYLLLQKTRYGEKITIRMDVDEELLSARMPKLLIQPLVENAIYHGLEHKVGGGSVALTVRREEGAMLITVEDDGVGARGEEISQQIHTRGRMNAFALQNIHERVEMRYGKPYGVAFYSSPGKGTRVEVRLPVDE